MPHDFLQRWRSRPRRRATTAVAACLRTVEPLEPRRLLSALVLKTIPFASAIEAGGVIGLANRIVGDPDPNPPDDTAEPEDAGPDRAVAVAIRRGWDGPWTPIAAVRVDAFRNAEEVEVDVSDSAVGTHFVRLNVTTADGRSATSVSRFEIVPPQPLSLDVQLHETVVPHGQVMTLDAITSGGTGEVEFSYFVRAADGRWGEQTNWVRGYGSVPHTRLLDPGDYLVLTMARPVGSTAEQTDVFDVSRFTVAEPDTPFAYMVPPEDTVAGEGHLRRDDVYHTLLNRRKPVFDLRSVAHQGAVVFVGDSMTLHWRDDFRGTFDDLHDGQKLVMANRAVSSDTTRTVLARLDEDVVSVNPAAVVLAIGSNDVPLGNPPDLIGRNLSLIVDRLRADDPDRPIVLNSLLPSTEEYGREVEDLLAVNEVYRSIAAADANITYIDLFPHFADADGRARIDLMPDQLHPNEAGYEVWAALVADALAEFGLNRLSADLTVHHPSGGPVVRGEQIPVWAGVTGGTGRYEFRQYVRPVGGQGFRQIARFSNEPLHTFDTAALAEMPTGDYRFRIEVRDTQGPFDGWIAAADWLFTLTEQPRIEIAETPLSTKQGQPLAVTLRVVSGGPEYEIAYTVRSQSGRWQPLSDWSDTFDGAPEAAALDAGPALLFVALRERGGNPDASWSHFKTFAFDVQPA